MSLAAAEVTALAPADAGAMDGAELADVFGIEIAPVEKGALPVKDKNKAGSVKKSTKSPGRKPCQ